MFYDGTKLTTSAKIEKRQTNTLKIDVAGVYDRMSFNSWLTKKYTVPKSTNKK